MECLEFLECLEFMECLEIMECMEFLEMFLKIVHDVGVDTRRWNKTDMRLNNQSNYSSPPHMVCYVVISKNYVVMLNNSKKG